MWYLMFLVLPLAVGLIARGYVNSQIKTYSSVPSAFGLSGVQMGQRMLAYNGVAQIPFHQGSEGQDHFDPRTNSITLDPHAFNTASITAVATACHEVGHACQFAKGYAPMKMRSALVPVVNLASNSWTIVLVMGILLNLAGLIDLAIILYAFAVLFQLVTLPVELNASHRAIDYLKTIGAPADEQVAAYKVLRACALTYVAAALVSLLQLLWLVAQRN